MRKGNGAQFLLPPSSFSLHPSSLFLSLTVLVVIALVVAVFALFTQVRPPTVEELERDIWTEWARLATDDQQLTLVDQLLEGRQAAGQNLVDTFAELIEKRGNFFVVHTQIRYIHILDQEGRIFAQWDARPTEGDLGRWKDLTIPLEDPTEGTVGTLQVGYRFYGGGLDYLPNMRRLSTLYNRALLLAVLLVTVLLIAAVANLSRIRERAARIKSQQITLDLAHQMCHELRNGLWAFSMEGKNLRLLFQLVDDYARLEPVAMQRAAERLKMPPSDLHRFRRAFRKTLCEGHVDLETDLLATNEMAKESEQLIENFSRYINLTVEELDRNLLGAAGWDLTPVSLGEAWKEACDLLELRFASAGVVHFERGLRSDDVVLADRRALVHVFINLAKNAIEAMRDREGTRELIFESAAGPTPREVRCLVQNSGSPIPPDVLPHIFESGFSTKSGAARGTGLALVRETVHRMNGTLDVHSTREEGTCFRLTFRKTSSKLSNAHE